MEFVSLPIQQSREAACELTARLESGPPGSLYTHPAGRAVNHLPADSRLVCAALVLRRTFYTLLFFQFYLTPFQSWATWRRLRPALHNPAFHIVMVKLYLCGISHAQGASPLGRSEKLEDKKLQSSERQKKLLRQWRSSLVFVVLSTQRIL